jgi:sec-independent protein translocase protein TatA
MALVFGFLNSPMEWGVVALLALLFFGNRLPSMMRNLGEGVTEFKKGMNGDKDEGDDENLPPRKEPPRKLEEGRVAGDARKVDEVRATEERPV